MADLPDEGESTCPVVLPKALLMTLWLLATSRTARRIAWKETR